MWDEVVREAALFYEPRVPSDEGPARASYHAIGRTMFEKYPAIESGGKNPWVSKVFLPQGRAGC